MEYRRRTNGASTVQRVRSNKKHGRVSGKKAESGGIAVNVLSIILPVAAFSAVFVLLLGNSVSDRLSACTGANITPLKSCYGSAQHEGITDTSISPTADVQSTPLPSNTEAYKASVKVSLQRITLYMLQMGVYSSYENSIEQAEELKKKGAAGYILEDNGCYRVIAAAYNDSEDANSVCERLNREGCKCTVYNYTCPGADLLITADNDGLQDIVTAFETIPNLLSEVGNCSIDFDSEKISIETLMAYLSETSSKAGEAKSKLHDSAESSDILMIVYTYLNDTEQMISSFDPVNCTKAETSSALKLLRVKLCMRYVSLLKQING